MSDTTTKQPPFVSAPLCAAKIALGMVARDVPPRMKNIKGAYQAQQGRGLSRDWHMLRGMSGGWHARKIKNQEGEIVYK